MMSRLNQQYHPNIRGQLCQIENCEDCSEKVLIGNYVLQQKGTNECQKSKKFERKMINALEKSLKVFFQTDVVLNDQNVLMDRRYKRPFTPLRSANEEARLYYHVEHPFISDDTSSCVYLTGMCLFGSSLKGINNEASVSLSRLFRYLDKIWTDDTRNDCIIIDTVEKNDKESLYSLTAMRDLWIAFDDAKNHAKFLKKNLVFYINIPTIEYLIVSIKWYKRGILTKNALMEYWNLLVAEHSSIVERTSDKMVPIVTFKDMLTVLLDIHQMNDCTCELCMLLEITEIEAVKFLLSQSNVQRLNCHSNEGTLSVLETYDDIAFYSYVAAIGYQRLLHPLDTFILNDTIVELRIANQYKKYFWDSIGPITFLHYLPPLTYHEKEFGNQIYYFNDDDDDDSWLIYPSLQQQ